MKKIGIIGSGPVGKALASGFIKHNYEVMIGSRDVAKLEEWKLEAGAHAHSGSAEEAAKFGEIIVLAVTGEGAVAAMESTGAINIAGKTVIDTTNPIDKSKPPVNGVLSLFTSQGESLMEQLQNQFPDANFVKAFNSVGNALMVDPEFKEGRPSMFICGNNEDAKKNVAEILAQFGWNTEDMGQAEAARALEPLVVLWCIRGFANNQWNHAFALYKK